MGIGHNQFQSIRRASINGIIPHHKAVGKEATMQSMTMTLL
jgi:hypothetical protein